MSVHPLLLLLLLLFVLLLLGVLLLLLLLLLPLLLLLLLLFLLLLLQLVVLVVCLSVCTVLSRLKGLRPWHVGRILHSTFFSSFVEKDFVVKLAEHLVNNLSYLPAEVRRTGRRV